MRENINIMWIHYFGCLFALFEISALFVPPMLLVLLPVYSQIVRSIKHDWIEVNMIRCVWSNSQDCHSMKCLWKIISRRCKCKKISRCPQLIALSYARPVCSGKDYGQDGRWGSRAIEFTCSSCNWLHVKFHSVWYSTLCLVMYLWANTFYAYSCTFTAHQKVKTFLHSIFLHPVFFIPTPWSHE